MNGPAMFCGPLVDHLRDHFKTCAQCRGSLKAILGSLPIAFKLLMPADLAAQVEALLNEGGPNGKAPGH